MNSNPQSFDENNSVSSIPMHIPPILGEYAYYDSRRNNILL